MLHDLSLAIKHLRRSPLFVIVSVVTLGLGIGISTTMLTMLDTIRHPYVPYRDVERLYSVEAFGDGASRRITAFEKYQALTEGTTSFAAIAGSVGRGNVLAEAYGNATQMPLIGVTGNYFPLLEMTPEAGRFFTDGPSGPDEDKIVISYGFWQEMLGSRPLSEDLHVTLDGRDYGVIGVMPAELLGRGLYVRLPALAGVTIDQRRGVWPVVRLKPGVTEEGAYADLNILASRLKERYGEGRQRFTFRLFSMKPDPRAISNFQLAMFGAAACVLVIACANLANLMLARALKRRPELALRMALGASRMDLIRQLMTESAVVGLLGGVAGTMVSTWGVGLVRLHLPASGRWIGFLAPRLDWRVYAFGVGLTIVATILFGLLPAITASNVSVSEPLKEGAGSLTGRTKHRYSGLVVAEVGICLVVLMAAGLMLRQLDQSNAYVTEREYQKGVVSGTVQLLREKLPKAANLDQEWENIRVRLGRVPGVIEVAVSSNQRAVGGTMTSDFQSDSARFIIGGFTAVSPNYLSVVGRRMLAGRGFEDGDRFSPVAIVDEFMAENLWPGMSPLGRMVKLGAVQSNAPWVRVVGVLRSDRTGLNPYFPRRGSLYVVLSKNESAYRELAARTNGSNSVLVGAVMRRIIRDMYPPDAWAGGFFYDRERMEREQLRPFAFITGIFSGLGGLSLLLAAVGMYGVLAYTVAQRMREFGIRIALGSDTRAVFRLVLHDAAVMILAGTAIGAWFAMWAGTMMVNGDTSIIPHSDWIALITSEALLLVVCFAACMWPAIRASRANPLDIIRAI